jgi:RHS repeat-associated protein
MQGLSGLPTGANKQLQFVYDWQGRRIQKKSVSNWNGSSYVAQYTNRFHYDGWNLIAELNGANNALIRSYIWGSDLSGSIQGAAGVGGLLTVKPASGDSLFAAYDGNGNVSGLVDATTGTNAAQYVYGPFGEMLQIAQTGANNPCPIRFFTKYCDDETDLLYYGWRYLDCLTGRWIGRDPVLELGGLNVCEFVNNDSVNKFDKDGRFPPVTGVILLTLDAAAACAIGPDETARNIYSDSSDKFKHCWVSCRISKKRGGLLAEIAGISKELRDRAVYALCNGNPNSKVCKWPQEPGGDFGDSVGDMRANQKRIGWESLIAGPVGGWMGAACRKSCADCCKDKVGYYGTVDGKSGGVNKQ